MDRLLHYEITEKLGKGKNGESYLSYDTALQRAVVIKPIARSLVADSSWCNWFDNQMAILSKIDDKRLALYYGRQEAEGYSFLTREYVSGVPLSCHDTDPLFQPDKLLHLALDISRALEVSHEKGLVHGNITPDNLFVTPDKRIKLVDFCLNVKMNCFEGNGDLTPLLSLSPEQLRGEPTTIASDMYSLGVLFYFMATGVMPHIGGTTALLLESKESGEIPWSSEICNKTSRMFRLLIGKLLSVDPQDRFNSAEELSLTLREIAGYSSDNVISIGKPESRWSARQFMMLAMLAALLLILLLLVSSIRY